MVLWPGVRPRAPGTRLGRTVEALEEGLAPPDRAPAVGALRDRAKPARRADAVARPRRADVRPALVPAALAHAEPHSAGACEACLPLVRQLVLRHGSGKKKETGGIGARVPEYDRRLVPTGLSSRDC